MRSRDRWILLVVTLFAGVLSGGGNAWATTWIPGLAAGSTAEAQAGGVPAAAPTGPAATCTGVGSTVKVTWTAVTLPAHGNPALSYTVFESTVSSSTGFTSVATGVVGTSWTSGALLAGNYWFEVAAVFGSNWPGPNSASTSQRTITLGLLCT
jgi:hypothetical protein